MDTTERITFLLAGYRQGQLHTSEWQELIGLLYGLDPEEREQLLLAHQDLWERSKSGLVASPAHEVDWQAMLDRILPTATNHTPAAVRNIPFYKKSFFKYAAAIVLFAGAGAYLYYHHTVDHAPLLATHQAPVQHDVLPGGQKAILHLSDGSTIVLDSAQNGQLALQGRTQIVKKEEGQVSYQSLPDASAPTAISYNTLETPRGGQYEVGLPDGTHVWLNAASSITYPTAFTGNERRIQMTGEAYFEVAKDQRRPFYAEVNGTTVQVLGTHFNINAYADETAMKTTLLEGRIQLHKGAAVQLLQPGQQAEVTDHITLIKNANTAQAVAWKNGVFYFDKDNVPYVLRQLSRWYDLDIAYQGKVTDDLFSGKIERNLPLKSILHLLDQGNLHFTLEGKKLTMLPE